MKSFLQIQQLIGWVQTIILGIIYHEIFPVNLRLSTLIWVCSSSSSKKDLMLVYNAT